MLTVSEETRMRQSVSQKKRFQRPEERKKLEKAMELSLRVMSLQERAQLMHEAFLKKYGNFLGACQDGDACSQKKT
jgi:hypothetical protein